MFGGLKNVHFRDVYKDRSNLLFVKVCCVSFQGDCGSWLLTAFVYWFMLPDIFGGICEYIKRFFLRAKQAPLNSYKINRIIAPFCGKFKNAKIMGYLPQSSKCKNAKINGFLCPFSNNQKATGLLRLFTNFCKAFATCCTIMANCR